LVWDLELQMVVPLELRRQLQSLGLKVRRAKLRNAWVGIAPVSYGTAHNGDVYPYFWAEHSPRQCVESPQASHDGVVMVLVGEGQESVAEAPPGGQWTIEMEDLRPGKYSLGIISNRKSISVE